METCYTIIIIIINDFLMLLCEDSYKNTLNLKRNFLHCRTQTKLL